MSSRFIDTVNIGTSSVSVNIGSANGGTEKVQSDDLTDHDGQGELEEREDVVMEEGNEDSDNDRESGEANMNWLELGKDPFSVVFQFLGPVFLQVGILSKEWNSFYNSIDSSRQTSFKHYVLGHREPHNHIPKNKELVLERSGWNGLTEILISILEDDSIGEEDFEYLIDGFHVESSQYPNGCDEDIFVRLILVLAEGEYQENLETLHGQESFDVNWCSEKFEIDESNANLVAFQFIQRINIL